MGRRGHGKSRGLKFFLQEKEVKINNCEQVFLYTAKYNQQLREQSLLAIGFVYGF